MTEPPAPLLVALLCLLVVGAVDAVMHHEQGISGDERFYERMASHPGGPHNFPYAYRIGVPWLVHVLPFSHVVSFTAIALLAIAASAGALYALLREFETPPALATALAVSFSLSPPLLVTLLRHGRSVDPVTVLVITIGTLFIVRRQRLALALTILAGATVHESCLFLIPFAYAVWARRLVDADALKDLALVATLPIVVYLRIRTSIDAVGKQYIPGYSGPFLRERYEIVKQGLQDGTWKRELRRLAAAYGPLWLTAPFALRTLPFARRGLVLVGLCALSMTFAFDWERVMFFAAPVIYVSSAHVIAPRRRLAVLTVAALFALDLGYGIYMQVYGVTHGLDANIVTSRPVPVF